MSRSSVAISVVLVIGLAAAAWSTPQEAPPPTIHNVTRQILATGEVVLVITGVGFGEAPVVTVDGQPVPVLAGASDTQATVLAPAAVLTMPGTYRLTVTDPARQLGDAFVVAGPPGTTAIALAGGEAPATSTTDPKSASTEIAVTPLAGGGTGLGLVESSGTPYTTAIGYSALAVNTGTENTAAGYMALNHNTTGAENIGVGYGALYWNTTGYDNTATGTNAMIGNTTGYYNEAFGASALFSNSSGYKNTAVGTSSLADVTTGHDNTAFGFFAGLNATTGSHNVFIGSNVQGTASDANTIRIGKPFSAGAGQNQTFIAGIRGTAVSAALPVEIDANGKLGATDTLSGANNVVMGSGTALPSWSGNVELNNEAGVGFHFRSLTAKFDIGPGSGGAPTYPGLLTLSMDGKVGIGTTSPAYKLHVVGQTYSSGGYVSSDRRLKEDVRDLRYGLPEVLRLRPVSYRWKDPTLGQPTLGLIAQEVQPVLPELISRGEDEAGLLSLNYTGLIPVLIKAIQEQQAQKDVEIAHLRAENTTLSTRLAALEEQVARLLKLENKPQSK